MIADSKGKICNIFCIEPPCIRGILLCYIFLLEIIAIDNVCYGITFFCRGDPATVLIIQYFTAICQVTGCPYKIIVGYCYTDIEIAEIIIKLLCTDILVFVPAINIIIYRYSWKEISNEGRSRVYFSCADMRTLIKCIIINNTEMDRLFGI